MDRQSHSPHSSPAKGRALREFRLLWVALWERYPVIFWSALWSSLLVLAAIAMVGLLNPELSQTPDANETSVAQRRDRPDPPTRDISPVWLFGLLITACGLGSYALTRCLHLQSPPARRALSRAQSSSARLAEATPDPPTQAAAAPQSLGASTTPTSAPPPSQVLPAAAPPAPPLPSPPAQQTPALPPSTQVPFAPPQAQRLHDLDRRAPGLAELLEIQRRRDRPPPRNRR